MTRPFTVAVLTACALIAFAGNSVLTRLALFDGAIGAGEFVVIRILSGAVTLALLIGAKTGWQSGTWRGAAALLGYALLFSFAYLNLSTGMGALILFASVQLAMIGWALISGERLRAAQIIGVVTAFSGLVYLLLPGLEQPDPFAAALMALSGLCWGVYSLLGRGQGDPNALTAGHFLRAAALLAPAAGVFLLNRAASGADLVNVSSSGVMLALLSGAVTSGLGYVVWYRALKHLSAVQAGIVQLLVPPLAALAGIILLSEPLTWRFSVASAIILCGIALTVIVKKPKEIDG